MKHTKSLLFLIAAASCGTATQSYADTQTWNGATASWNTANWDSGNTWTAGNAAVVNGGKVNLDGLWNVSAITINGGEVAQTTFPDPFGVPAPTVITVNAGGTLSAAMGSHLGPITMAGGNLAGSGNEWGSWWFQNITLTATGNTTSTLSAANMVLQSGSTNTFSVDAGSTLNVTGTFASAANVATYNLNAGTLLKTGAGTMTLAGNNNYKGTTRVTGGTLAFSGTNNSGGNLQVIGSGALVQITGGTTTVASTGGDSYVIGGSTVEIAGGSLLVQGGSAWFSVGAHIANAGGAGTLTLTSGSFTNNNSWGITVGAASGGIGTVNINGGTFTEDDVIDNGIVLGEGNGNGIINLNAGTLTADRIHVGGGTGTVNFNGGKLMTTGAYSGTVMASYGNLTANIQSGGLVVGGTNNMTIAQALVNGGRNGGVTKEDANMVTLSGANNTYTGNTTVTGGTLKLAASSTNNISSSARIIVGDTQANNTARLDVTGLTSTTLALTGSQTLAGHGTVTGGISTASGTHIAPGNNGIGSLTFDGSGTTGTVLNMASGSIFDWDLSANGGTSDQVNFWNYSASDFVLNGNTVNLNLSGTKENGTYTATLFKFFSDSGTTLVNTGITSGLSLGTLGSGISAASFTYNGSTISLNYTVVPEPTSALAGLLITAGLLRRRRC